MTRRAGEPPEPRHSQDGVRQGANAGSVAICSAWVVIGSSVGAGAGQDQPGCGGDVVGGGGILGAVAGVELGLDPGERGPFPPDQHVGRRSGLQGVEVVEFAAVGVVFGAQGEGSFAPGQQPGAPQVGLGAHTEHRGRPHPGRDPVARRILAPLGPVVVVVVVMAVSRVAGTNRASSAGTPAGGGR